MGRAKPAALCYHPPPVPGIPSPRPRPASLLRLAWLALLLLAMAAGLAGAQAPEPPAYTIAIIPTGDAEIDDAVAATSTLQRLADQPLAAPAALIARARGDRDRAGSTLRALGYFDGEVLITIAGLPLDDAALPARLNATPAPVPVTLAIRPGPRTTIASVAIQDTHGADLAATLGLPDLVKQADLLLGAPARGADIVAAEARVLRALLDDGRAFARTGVRTLTLDRARHELSVVLRFDPGNRVRIGTISVQGLDRLNPRTAQARMAPFEGRILTPEEIDAARRKLLDLGVFSSVRAQTAPAAHQPGDEVDVTMAATERPLRNVSLTAAYATSEGASFGATWLHRNLFGQAERLELGAEVNHIAAGSPGELGYRVGAALSRPDFLRLDQTLRASAQALREITDAYDKTGVIGTIGLRRVLSPRLSVGLGVSAERSRITDTLGTNNYTLLGLPAIVTWRNTGDSLLDIKRGVRTEFRITPYPVAEGSVPGLTTLRSDTSFYQPLDADAHSVLALRGQLGLAIGASTPNIPADLRLFAGGSGTIRGFAYQSVGPLNSAGQPLGGTTMVAATAELRQAVYGPWGMVAFVDAGGVSGERAPNWPERIGVGVGLGVRYDTVIGPVRADVGFPVSGKREGDAFWQLYVGIGQAF